jgi:hypothetical protein
MAMTLEMVRDRLASWYGGSEACLDVKACAELGDMIAALNTHLTQPAQSVDVERVAAIGYEAWMDDPGLWSHANNMERARWTKIAQAIITRALSAEKAGWRIEKCGDVWHISYTPASPTPDKEG